MVEVAEHKLKIKEIIDEASKVKTFRMELPDNFPMDFFPGQFYMVRFEDDEKLKRAYSVASSPTEEGILDITLDIVGEFTGKLWETKPGDELCFKGPYGRFYFGETMENNLVLIAGGMGITPMRSIYRYCKDKKLANKINMLYSIKRPENYVYEKEIEEIKDIFDKLTITVTRPEETDEWNGKTGRIDKKMLEEHSFDIKTDLYFICGPNEFVKSVRESLYDLGAQKEQIKTDTWGE